MSEEAVAEVVTEVAEPEVVESPQGEPTVEEDGTRQQLLKDLFKGATVAELKAALDEVPPEIRADLEGEIERRGEQRVQTRQKEVDTAQTERTSAYKLAKDNAQVARISLSQRINKAKQGDTFALSDPDLLASEIDAYRNGAIAESAIENEGLMKPLREQYLPDPTSEEKAKLEKALYEDGRRGTLTQIPVVADLIKQRAYAEGLAEGIKQGQQSVEAKGQLAEKLTKLTLVKKQAAGVTPNGRPSTAGDERTRLQAEIRDFDPTKLSPADAQAKLAELRAKEVALRS